MHSKGLSAALNGGVDEFSDKITDERGLVLTYAENELDVEQFSLFVRSLRATGSRCACVVVIKNVILSQAALSIGDTFNVQFVPATHRQEESFPAVMGRFIHWEHYLMNNRDEYAFIINCDYDIFFQLDPFEFFFGNRNAVRGQNDKDSLHVFAENPVTLIGDCAHHKVWYCECDSLGGSSLFELHKNYPRICAGISIGTTLAHKIYLQRMVEEIRRTRCNDQGIHNMLLWQNSFRAVDVYVWDDWDGPVKPLDVGYLRDQFGRVLNEQGFPYCVIHQFKPDRNAHFMSELKKHFVLYEAPTRIVFEDTRFEPCDHHVCQGKRVHVAALSMIKQNMTKGFWGDIPNITATDKTITTSLFESGYRTVATFRRESHR